jgi:class I fructose-bisphosphate aldolase
MATILWCYLRNSGFKKDGKDYHTAADLTGQANHLGVTIQADIIKQKLPTNNGGYTAVATSARHIRKSIANFQLRSPDRPLPLSGANCYMGRMGLINSGGESKGASDLSEAVDHRGHQQARGWPWTDLRPQGIPKTDDRRRCPAQRHSGCLPQQGGPKE